MSDLSAVVAVGAKICGTLRGCATHAAGTERQQARGESLKLIIIL